VSRDQARVGYMPCVEVLKVRGSRRNDVINRSLRKVEDNQERFAGKGRGYSEINYAQTLQHRLQACDKPCISIMACYEQTALVTNSQSNEAKQQGLSVFFTSGLQQKRSYFAFVACCAELDTHGLCYIVYVRIPGTSERSRHSACTHTHTHISIIVCLLLGGDHYL